eukprot:3790488-Alexandrium_andersonii.AAC.1
MARTGSPTRTCPFHGSMNVAVPGPTHHGSPSPEMSPFQCAVRRRSVHASSSAVSMWAGMPADAGPDVAGGQGWDLGRPSSNVTDRWR